MAAPKRGSPTGRARAISSAVRAAPVTRLASIAASAWLRSIVLRWTRALPKPSKVKITASGTKISGTTA